MHAPRNLVHHAIIFDLFDHRARLLVIVLEALEQNLFAITFVRPELFPASAQVVLNYSIRRLQDGIGGAIILFELDDFDFSEVLFEVEQVRDFGAAPAVNALIVIANDAKIPVLLREQINQVELRGIRVLVFVHHDIAILMTAGAEHFGVFLKQFEREQQQVIEIHCVTGAQSGLIARDDMLGECSGGVVRKRI